ncbi:hypothetical protein MMPV_008510 [Pyropia vietnamensis]
MVKAERSPCVAILEAYGVLRDAVNAAAIAPASAALLLSRVAALLRGLRDLEAVPARVARFRVDTGAQWAIHEAIRSATAVVEGAAKATPVAAVTIDRGVVGAAVARIAASVEAHAPLSAGAAAEVAAAVADSAHAVAALEAHPLTAGRCSPAVAPVMMFADLFSLAYDAQSGTLAGTPVNLEYIAEADVTPAIARALHARVRLRHPNLLTLYGVVAAPPLAVQRHDGSGVRHDGSAADAGDLALALVSEAALDGGATTLYEALAAAALDTPAKMRVLLDVASALVFLHSNGYAHGGLHPGVVVFANGLPGPAKLARPGLYVDDESRGGPLYGGEGNVGGYGPAAASSSAAAAAAAAAAGVTSPWSTGGIGPVESPNAADGRRYFVSPEVAAHSTPSTASDVWAFGQIAYALFSGRQPYAGAQDGLEGGLDESAERRVSVFSGADASSGVQTSAGASLRKGGGRLVPGGFLSPSSSNVGRQTPLGRPHRGNLMEQLLAGVPPSKTPLLAANTPPAVIDLIYTACLAHAPGARAPSHAVLSRLVALRRAVPLLFGDGGPGGAATSRAARTFERALGEHITDGGGVQAALRAIYRLRFRGEPLASTANLRAPGRVWAVRAAAGDADAAWNLHACYRRGHFVARDLYVALDWLVVSRRAAEKAAAQAARGERWGAPEEEDTATAVVRQLAAVGMAGDQGAESDGGSSVRSRGTTASGKGSPSGSVVDESSAGVRPSPASSVEGGSRSMTTSARPRTLASLAAGSWVRTPSAMSNSSGSSSVRPPDAGRPTAGSSGLPQGLRSSPGRVSTNVGAFPHRVPSPRVSSTGSGAGDDTGLAALTGLPGVGGVPAVRQATPREAAETVAALEAAVRVGSPTDAEAAEALFQLGMVVALGWGGATRDPVRAGELFAAAMGLGHADATNAMGERFRRLGESRKAAAAFLTAESLGSLAATVNRAVGIVDALGTRPAVGMAGPGAPLLIPPPPPVSPDAAAQAFSFLDGAAKAGFVPALYLSGRCLAAGIGTPTHVYKAFERYAAAAAAGSADAQYHLGMAYLAGAGTPASPAGAAPHLRAAAAQGMAPAAVALGELLRDGAAGVEADPTTAISLWQSAADAGSAPARRWLGLEALRRGDSTEGVQQLSAAAAGGDAAAATALGDLYSTGTAPTVVGGGAGRGGALPAAVTRDTAVAAKWYAMATELGAGDRPSKKGGSRSRRGGASAAAAAAAAASPSTSGSAREDSGGSDRPAGADAVDVDGRGGGKPPSGSDDRWRPWASRRAKVAAKAAAAAKGGRSRDKG